MPENHNGIDDLYHEESLFVNYGNDADDFNFLEKMIREFSADLEGVMHHCPMIFFFLIVSFRGSLL